MEIPAEALREALTNALCHRQFYNTSSSVGIAIYDDRVEIENIGHLPDELTIDTIKQSHQSYPQNPVIADVLFKTTFLENWGSGVSRMVDACKNANLPEPDYNQNATFVWVTFWRSAEQMSPQPPQVTPLNPHKLPPQPPQVNLLDNPLPPTTSKREIEKAKRLKALLSAIGSKGVNIKTLMESLQRKDRKSFLSTYITPNIEAGYIAMLFPESPNHPMQSYYLTNKGRFFLEQL